jgi:hypothetical protein
VQTKGGQKAAFPISELVYALTRITRRIAVRRRIVGARILRVVCAAWIVAGIAGRISAQATWVAAVRSAAPAAHSHPVLHPAIAGERTGNPARGLLLFAGLDAAAEFDRAVSDIHAEVVVVQRGLVLERVLDLALQRRSVIDAHTGSRG